MAHRMNTYTFGEPPQDDTPVGNPTDPFYAFCKYSMNGTPVLNANGTYTCTDIKNPEGQPSDPRKGVLPLTALINPNPLTDIAQQAKNFYTQNPGLTLAIVGAAAYFFFIKK